MTTNNFINECVKCINMCKKEFSSEFAEWIEKLILTEVAGASENTDCVTDTKPITKELSIANIKKELMDEFLSDMRIINSFADKRDKTTDYIRKNVFDYLDQINSCTHADSYICFDVAQRNNNFYNVYVVVKTHKDILDKDGENKLDYLANIIESIVRKAYPYMTKYDNNPKMCANHYAERHIYFSLNNYDKENYENGVEEKALF